MYFINDNGERVEPNLEQIERIGERKTVNAKSAQALLAAMDTGVAQYVRLADDLTLVIESPKQNLGLLPEVALDAEIVSTDDGINFVRSNQVGDAQ